MKYLLLFLFCINFNGVDFFASTYSYHLSGAWYPSRGKLLSRTLSDLDKKACAQFPSSRNLVNVKAIIVPHAGYGYSGVVATSAYQKLTRNFFKRVVILAPLHNFNVEGIGLPGVQYLWYKSPLGHIQLDVNMIEKLKASSSLFIHSHEAHELEHSIEVQIPLIQRYCGNCKIVPLLVGSLSQKQMQEVASCIGKLLDDTTLVIISSDFTHYGKSFGYVPFCTDILQNIFKLDSAIIQKIQDGNPQEFAAFLQDTKATVCGKDTIAILLYMIQAKYLGDVSAHLVGYDSSAFDQQNPDHCVSYVSMVFTKQDKNQIKIPYGMFG